MADNGIWFKLWCSADDDPDLGNMDIRDFGRWCRFGMYMKRHGTEGRIELKPPCLPLQHKLQVASFDAVLDVIRCFPNCNVSYETVAIVTWKNWQKYQGDKSTERVRRFRQRETPKKRRDEKRRDEKRNNTPIPPKGDDVSDFQFENFWRAYPRKVGKAVALKSWRKEAGLVAGLPAKIVDALERHKKQEQWTKDGGQFIPHPATWLNQRRWEDEVVEGAGGAFFTAAEEEEQRRIARKVYGMKDGD